MKTEWKGISDTPPDEMVEVLFDNGEIMQAMPCYYPFKVIKKEIIPCESYFDGTFMLDMSMHLEGNTGNIIKWREYGKRKKL